MDFCAQGVRVAVLNCLGAGGLVLARRVSVLRQLLAVIGPVLVGITVVLVLAAFGFVVAPGR